jgi:replicative DNA helicase
MRSGMSNLYSLEAERYVVGCLLVNPLKIAELSGLNEESFYYSSYRFIYKAVVELLDNGCTVDVVTVSDRLKSQNLLEQVGGRAFVNDLALDIITTANIGYYAKIVSDKAVLRSVNKLTANIKDLIDSGEEREAIVDRAQDLFLGLCQNNRGSKPQIFGDFIADIYNGIEERVENKGKLAGLDTGFIDLNNYTGGLQASDLVILAARPSMGKTALSLNIAENVASIYDLPVVIFSLEMSKEQLGLRL